MTERISGHTEPIELIMAPIHHSKSPKMHNEASIKLGLGYVYLTLEVGNRELEGAVKGSKALRVRGYNVSTPNKTVIGQYLDHLSPAAELCGVVNTAVDDNGVLTGHITDDIGYMRSLRDIGIESVGKKATITGAGEAATAIEIQMALDGVEEISILNRRDEFWERAEQNVKSIDEKISYKAMLSDLVDAEAFERRIGDSHLSANAAGVRMESLEGR